MQTTQKITLQIPFPRLEHFNRDVGNTLHLFALCKGIQDRLGFWIPRCGFQIPGTGFQSLSVELGFWIPIVSGIPDSMNCIPDSISKIFPVSGFLCMGWTCLSKTGWRRILRSTRLLCGEILIPIWILNICELKLIPSLKRIKLYNRSYFFIQWITGQNVMLTLPIFVTK